VFGCHLEAYPYGPYDLRDDPTLTTDALVAVATETRGHQIGPILAEMTPLVDRGEPVFLGGDFNEPSHLDWTEDSAKAGQHFGRAVPWPTSRAIHATGLADAYRMVHPDPEVRPADTWTPLKKTPDEVHDRIDKLYFAGKGVLVTGASVVGEDVAHADIVVTPYPSDHRAVCGTFSVPVR
jgi:endonuclease/exonuclease/phosphatase family metal-dependent hydrolase